MKNVLASHGATVVTRGRRHDLVDPRVVTDPDLGGMPAPVALVLRRIHVEQFVDFREAPA